MLPYDKFMYLWPPRPETTIKPMSSHYEIMKSRRNFYAQFKKNGQRNVLYIDPDFNIQWWNRHASGHLNYNAPPWLVDEIKSVVKPTGKWMVIDGELLHNKDRTVKNALYWWDILVYDGQYLVGTKYHERQRILLDALTPPTSGDEAEWTMSPHITVARNIPPEKYDEMWQKAQSISVVEGFVFKNINGTLKPCIGEHNNSDWMVRCRKTTGRHPF